MAGVNSLSLSKQQEQHFINRIKERSSNIPTTIKADFSNMKANAVDFSFLKKMSKTTMNETQGRQFSVPLKSSDGMQGELVYTEVNGAWVSHTAIKTKENVILEKLKSVAHSNDNFKKFFNHAVGQGYILKTEEEYVINHDKYLRYEKEDETLVDKVAMYVIPIYQDKKPVGMLTIDDKGNNPVIGLENKRTIVNETGEIITIQADACNISWTKCMADCLPGCDTWRGCLILFGTCLSACCGCVSVLLCVACAACLVVGGYCLFSCRMCVYGAARPQECKY